MKTLTTLTAVAALIAGISVASAASSMDKSDSMGSELVARDRHRQVLHQRCRRRAELPICQPVGLSEDRQERRDLQGQSEQRDHGLRLEIEIEILKSICNANEILVPARSQREAFG